jgi:hypothetical protein
MIGRRAFLNGLAAAGAGSLVGTRPTVSGEPPPETTRLRLAQPPRTPHRGGPDWRSLNELKKELKG